MGEYRNRFLGNAIAGTTGVVMVILTAVLIWNGITS
jgi:hypothetical protein